MKTVRSILYSLAITMVAMSTITLLLSVNDVAACTENGRNCKYSYECCSQACSAVFGFCLPR
ncbi:Conotoxin-like protein 1 [Perigonia lusca single nucleopolyhedrovirus]|uniref:Conotoxin-like protein 1 n=1 Tax=Perigonia lusca single nucleopolyhedrovirus TaxID=1675865 RepID=A0A0M3WQZ9_9ABAC|nr:Conotoxin-like protein 1 [Perigonia lusca single nucleopolyhedrovirus]AKN80570.1 Conotoxin-like protein 1 [Perigonia lusca single nucleopolyhedrovirus]